MPREVCSSLQLRERISTFFEALWGLLDKLCCVFVYFAPWPFFFLQRLQAAPLPRVLGGGQLSGPPSSHFQLRLWESGDRGSVPQGWLISCCRPRLSHPASWSCHLNIIRSGWWTSPTPCLCPPNLHHSLSRNPISERHADVGSFCSNSFLLWCCGTRSYRALAILKPFFWLFKPELAGKFGG